MGKSASQANKSFLPGISDAITRINDQLRRLASREVPVFISGDAGTEKAFAAKMVHVASPRSENPFSKTSISWKIPPDLGARFQACDTGTLLISLQRDFPVDMQYTILEMANDQAFGDPLSGDLIQADVRIILSTSINLSDPPEGFTILPELQDYLEEAHVHIPPIRTRPEDIPALVRYATRRAYKTGRSKAQGADAQVLALFRMWHWPGNAEDLLLVTAESALNADGELITLQDIPQEFLDSLPPDLYEQAEQVQLPRNVSQSGTSVRKLSNYDTRVGDSRSAEKVAAARGEELRQKEAEERRRQEEEEATVEAALARNTDDEETREIRKRENREEFAEIRKMMRVAHAAESVEVAEDASATQQDRFKRLHTLARRLKAQSSVLSKQVDGPLADETQDMSGTDYEAMDPDALVESLESELDSGLEAVMTMRRQLAKLNQREQQTMQTARDIYRRLILAGTPGTSSEAVEIPGLSPEDTKQTAAELTSELSELDQVINRINENLTSQAQIVGLNSQDATAKEIESLANKLHEQESKLIAEAILRAREREELDEKQHVERAVAASRELIRQSRGEGIAKLDLAQDGDSEELAKADSETSFDEEKTQPPEISKEATVIEDTPPSGGAPAEVSFDEEKTQPPEPVAAKATLPIGADETQVSAKPGEKRQDDAAAPEEHPVEVDQSRVDVVSAPSLSAADTQVSTPEAPEEEDKEKTLPTAVFDTSQFKDIDPNAETGVPQLRRKPDPIPSSSDFDQNDTIIDEEEDEDVGINEEETANDLSEKLAQRFKKMKPAPHLEDTDISLQSFGPTPKERLMDELEKDEE